MLIDGHQLASLPPGFREVTLRIHRMIADCLTGVHPQRTVPTRDAARPSTLSKFCPGLDHTALRHDDDAAANIIAFAVVFLMVLFIY